MAGDPNRSIRSSEAPDIQGSWGADGGRWSVLVHGGAGDVRPEALAHHIEGCRAAALAAAQMLAADGSALNAAQRAVEVLEDDPQFNAGTGACLNEDGAVELDASIMEGTLLRAGGVCALPPFQHPIAIARAVLNDGVHVLFAGEGATRFALSRGFARARDEDMVTEAARDRLARVRAGLVDGNWAGGTVGAVVRDAAGTVVAATSTGGRVNKAAGRVGDSPIIGAGTYADDEAGACSNTGDGEAFLRLCLAKTAIEWMRSGMHPEDAARAAVRFALGRTQGTGGTILIDRFGRLGWARSTHTMTWAAASEGWSEVLGGG
jgi:beta-aspartyl-peptidase (threonine type)